MIDFHTHIIPNVDDGSKSMEETIDMLKEAQKAGFDKIILTSHYIENYYETKKEDRKILIDKIADELPKKNINIELFLGNEIYLSENIVKLLQEQKACTINNTNYVLFELPLNSEKPMNLYDVIYEMMQYNYKPILAHPERYSFVQNKPEIIYDLIEKGVLMQSNFGSIIGLYGRRAQIIVKNLLKSDMVHFLGSDVHRKNSVYAKLNKALSDIKEIIGEKKLEEITSVNPNHVLKNEKIEILEPEHIKLSFGDKLKMEFNKN